MKKWSIPTEYNGTRYRSKLEAAWARFFDVHRMKFAYEPEGFDFDGVRYLSPQEHEEWVPNGEDFQEEVSLCRCHRCHRWYFRDELMSWHCTACDFHDGDRTFDFIHGDHLYGKCLDCGA